MGGGLGRSGLERSTSEESEKIREGNHGGRRIASSGFGDDATREKGREDDFTRLARGGRVGSSVFLVYSPGFFFEQPENSLREMKTAVPCIAGPVFGCCTSPTIILLIIKPLRYVTLNI